MSRAEWLELARQQSRKLADTKGQHVPPLQWDRVVGRPAKTARSESAPPRPLGLSWALWVLLPLLILGGAGGTWAFVSQMQNTRRAPRQEVAIPAVEPAGEPLPASARRAQPVAAPEEVQEQQDEPAPPRRVRPRQKSKKSPEKSPENSREKSREKKEVATRIKTGAAPATATNGTETIIFGTSDAPGGGAIIVPPPAKQKPLWTPEIYKKRGRRNAHW